jgi:A/G-specific adenine glycosylase
VDLAPDLTGAVRAWGRQHRRDLPWRRTRDPWAVLVSEVMLQQTQAARVVPVYRAFLDEFPDPAACAVATVGAVVRAWHGLGYNRRAARLHAAATTIADEYGGVVPCDLRALRRLPGVGGYTARAVLAFSFEVGEAVVDTNIARVLARLEGRPLSPSVAQATADRLVPQGEAWEWNTTMMDLGALVCTKAVPACGRCPLAGACAWATGGCRAPDPAGASAFVSRPQSRFEGSDRQGRGRLVAALRRKDVPWGEVPEVMGWDGDIERARRVALTLVDDGLALGDASGLRLP